MRQRPLAVIFLTVLVDLIGVGILIPVIPQLLANPQSPHYLLKGVITSGQGYIVLGLLTAVYPLMSFLAAPILGQLSDRYGRRKILAICLAGTAIGYALFAVAILMKNLPLLFLSRILDGITGGKLADPTVVSWFNATTPFWFAAGLAALNLVSVLLFFPETRKLDPIHRAFRWLQSFTNIGAAFRWKELRGLFIASFLFCSGFSFFVTFFNVFLTNRFGFTEGQIGNYFSYIGICIVLGQTFIVRALSGKLPAARILRYSMLVTAMTIFAQLFVREAWQLFLIPPFMAAANSLTMSNLMSLVSRTAGPDRQGEILGVNAGILSLSNALPPLLAGFIAARLSISAPIAIGALICICGWIAFGLATKAAKEA